MKVLVACEESQAVCKAFRRRGHEAYSCDIIPCSGGHPEWHIMWDALALVNGHCSFMTTDGTLHKIGGGLGHIDCVPALHLHYERGRALVMGWRRSE